MKRALSMKWYSRPSSSFCRGFRVVCETEKRSSGWASRMRVFSVVFPAPDGDDRMSKRKSSSFDILHLLSHPLDFGLEFYHKVHGPKVLRLGSNRIYLARHLLQKEIEPPSHGLVVGQVGQHLLDVTRQAGQLFGDVRALEKEGHFLLHAQRVDEVAVGLSLRHDRRNPREALLEFSRLDLEQVGRAPGDAFHQVARGRNAA